MFKNVNAREHVMFGRITRTGCQVAFQRKDAPSTRARWFIVNAKTFAHAMVRARGMGMHVAVTGL